MNHLRTPKLEYIRKWRSLEMGFLDRLTWKEYLLIGGLLIIWATVAFFGVDALGRNDNNGLLLLGFLGVIGTGALLIIIAFVDRVF